MFVREEDATLTDGKDPELLTSPANCAPIMGLPITDHRVALCSCNQISIPMKFSAPPAVNTVDRSLDLSLIHI